MKPAFREDKATQAAALLLKLRGCSMSHLKLMKLLYLAEREALIKLGRPITYDAYVSMDHGPVLSATLNLINGDCESEGPWSDCITTPKNHEVQLSKDPGCDLLSEAEEDILRDIFKRYGSLSRWDVRNLTHDLEEWQDPHGSSLRIEYIDILRAAKKTDAEIQAILDDLESIALAEKLFDQ